ncbi:hypothetical protein IG631_15274 [Alternaria alternata]|nr:hypothetical protein IG631_15274 [Alternaria alternata]
MLDPILCCAILQILRARGETPAFAARLVGKGGRRFATRMRHGEDVEKRCS